MRAYICTQNVFVGTETVGEDKINKLILMKNLVSKSDFGLFLAKSEKSHKEPRKTSLRAHMAISNGFPDFLTPQKHRIEKSIFSRFSSQNSIFRLCVNVNNQNPDFQAHEKSDSSALCTLIRAANASYDYQKAREDRIEKSIFSRFSSQKSEKNFPHFCPVSHISHRSQLEAVC